MSNEPFTTHCPSFPTLLIIFLCQMNPLQTLPLFSNLTHYLFLSNEPFTKHCPSFTSPRELAFTWWGCCGLCQSHKQTELAHAILFCSCVYFCLYGPFNCISFHKLSRQVSAFSLCSSGLKSALLVFSSVYLLMKVSLGPVLILCG